MDIERQFYLSSVRLFANFIPPLKATVKWKGFSPRRVYFAMSTKYFSLVLINVLYLFFPADDKFLLYTPSMLAGASVCAAFTGLGISDSHRNSKSWSATKLASLLQSITNIEPVSKALSHEKLSLLVSNALKSRSAKLYFF